MKPRHLIPLICLIFARLASAESLADLDAIVSEAGSVKAFLDSPAQVQRYFEASEKYYPPGKFPRDKYDMILKQMRGALETVPELADRLFEKRDGATFAVSSEAPTFARGLNSEAFERLVAGWAKPGPVIEDARARALMDELAGKEEAIEVELAGVGRKKKAAMRAERYTALRADPRLKELAAYFFRKHLETPAMARVLGSRDADLILSQLQGIKESPAALLPQGLGARVPGVLLSELKDQFPAVKELIDAKGGAFPPLLVKTPKGDWIPAEPGRKMEVTFRALPRAFHGAFKSIAVDECVGAGYKFNGGDTTPERWAVEVIRGAQHQTVEVDGKWTGFVLRVPVSTPDGLAASTDVVSPFMRQRILQKDGAGHVRSTTVFDAWLRAANKTKPAEWIGHVVGDSFAINNVGAVVAVRTGPGYVLSPKAFARANISQPDEIVTKLTALRARDTSALQRYGGHMIYDAIVPEVKTVRLLADSEQTTEEALRGMIERGEKENVTAFIKSAYLAAHDHDGARNRVGDLILQLHGQNVLGLLATSGTFRIDKWDNKHGDLVAYAPTLVAAGFGPRELAWARRVGGLSAAEDAKFVDATIDRIDNATSFIDYLRPTWPGEGWPKYADLSFAKHVDKFFALKPSFDEVLRAMTGRSEFMTVTDYAKLVDHALPLAESPERILEALRKPLEKISPAVAVMLLKRLAIHMEPHRKSGFAPGVGEKVQAYIDELLKFVDAANRPKLGELDAFLHRVREATLAEKAIEIQRRLGEANVGELVASHLTGEHRESPDWLDALAKLIAEKKVARDEASRRAVEDVVKVTGVSESHPLWRAGRRLQLLTAPDAASYLKLVPGSWSSRTSAEQHIFRAVMDESLDHFLSLSPTPEQKREILAAHKNKILSPESVRRLVAEPDVSELPPEAARRARFEHYLAVTKYVLEKAPWSSTDAPTPDLAPEALLTQMMRAAPTLPELSAAVRSLRTKGSDATRKATRAALVGELPRIAADPHPWEHIRQLKDALPYYEDIIKLQDELLESPHYQGADKFAHVADLAIDPAPETYAKANRKWINDNVGAHFLAGAFTADDLKILQRALGHRDNIITLQGLANERLRDRIVAGERVPPAEIERMLSSAYAAPGNEYKVANSKLVAKSLHMFAPPQAGMTPHELFEHYEIMARLAVEHGADAALTTSLVESALDHAADPEEFTRVVKRMGAKMSDVLKTRVARFMALAPTWAQIRALKAVVPTYADIMVVQTAALTAGLVKNGEDFLHLTEYHTGTPHADYRVKLNEWITAHAKEHFFARPHTAEDLKALQRIAHTSDDVVRLQKAANEHLASRPALSPNEIVDYLAFPWQPPQKEYIAKHVKQVATDLPGLIHHFAAGELEPLKTLVDADIARRLPTMLAASPKFDIRRHVKSAEEFILVSQGAPPEFFKKHLTAFLKLDPTFEQILAVAPHGLSAAMKKIATGEQLGAWAKAVAASDNREKLVRTLWKGKNRLLALPGLRGAHLAPLLASVTPREPEYFADVARSALLLSTSPAEVVEALRMARTSVVGPALAKLREIARDFRPTFGTLEPTGGERRAYAAQIGVGAWVKQCVLGLVGLGK